MAEVLSVIAFLLFAVGLWLGSTRTLLRIFHYRHEGWRYPDLIWRDITVQGGLAITFLLVSSASILDDMGVLSRASLSDQWWWIVISRFPAVVAVWTYTYYEIFRLDRIRGEEK